jgi:hypothetical protein
MRAHAFRILIALLAGCPLLAAPARAQDAQPFSTSNLQLAYGWTFNEPGIAEDVPKSDFTFENTSAGTWWSSYLFVDVLRSWSEADANAKEVYGEWYPSMSLRRMAGKKPWTGFVRDISLTAGLNTGTRSTGPSPFAVLPGTTIELKVPGFAFFSVGAFAYIDRGRFQGQPTSCAATTCQVTPSWSLPFAVRRARLRFDGFVDIIGRHAECATQVLSMPQIKFDLSGLWGKPDQVYLAMRVVYWHNKYGLTDLQDKQVLPVLIWVLQ